MSSDVSTTTETTAAVPAPPAALGGRAATGFLWVLLNVAFGRVLQFGAVAVMGTLLTTRDFGLVSLALSIATFISTFRDGGVRDYLVAHQKDYASLVGPCFWLTNWINLGLGLMLGLVGEVAARVLHEQGKIDSVSDLTILVWILAASVPLGTPSTTMLAKLKIDLRFQALSAQMTMTSIIRYGGQIAFAVLGMGAVGYILPAILLALADNIFLYAATREKAWLRPAEPKRWGEIWGGSKWMVLSSVAAGIANYGFAVCASPFLPEDVALTIMGSLFFAISIHLALEGLLAQSLVQIMLPVLSRLKDDPERQTNAAIRVMNMNVLVAAPLSTMAALAFKPAANLIWGSKWDEAAVAIMILVPCFVLRSVLAAVVAPLAQAQHRFKLYFLIWLYAGSAAIIGAIAGALVFGTLNGVAASISVLITLAGGGAAMYALTSAGARHRVILDGITRPMLISAVAGAAVWWLDYTFLGPELLRLFPQVITVRGHEFQVHYALQSSVVAITFVAIVTPLLRVFAAGPMREAIGVLPARLNSVAKRLMRL